MHRILIIAPNWIGDAVMSQPFLVRLQLNYPKAQIDVLATPWVAPIYRACEQIHEVIEAPLEHKKLQWSLRKQLAQRLKAKSYQACFVLPNSFKSALIPWLANIPFRLGYRGEARFGLINFALTNPSKTERPPMVEHYLALANLLNHEELEDSGHAQAPSLQISLEIVRSMQDKLKRTNINQDSLYVFCPGAEYGVTKRWPAESFAELAKKVLAQNTQAQIILLGSQNDHHLGQMITGQDGKRIHNWCGQTSLDEAMAIISLCKTIVSNDSGLMHIAAALRKPQIAIFGSSDPQHTPPLSDKAKVIWLNLPCSPCHHRECPLGHLKCLKEISPEQVFNSLTA
ncbi:lipopolysaccharide heptosyltransferase II [Polynucleobacter paneuropaeus]|jgi:heptosyltransferase-2|uniref:lipopolysaccharide heptosyltransferase II n=1 Tax=Polynucleobacter paneuropaeus TaxID=2527775 RepID=A0A9Q2ZX02_9BURK|nr:lipopolysaccharide heptosyltransferase II [Polynucleobacter paneuropaeus]AWW46747.1 lipopolysaccharide heptosyltransferase II [Polynucleobacter paneuropaeus]MBT8541529.1 lipopolysaccharide heptosyltransferase II [Polynucleobacter paneuropaeus]MBT8548819.1 lipopolysaccharide heptosyltransferase II [Polynucleobacter paneuropaeus]MBT8551408.1 lipopolysaccharide heptosyltransferase II [Polynucleobacter paneuropaeus]MBT8558771.1 lipopolysaccharide heptosyltransferase II [Polynucleobacter paneuro